MDIRKFTEKASENRLLGIKISQKGKPAAEWLAEEECRRNIYSASKSYTAIAVGFALQEGLLSLEEKLTDAFEKDLPSSVSDNLAKATVRDLLTMRLGQENGNLMGGQRPFYKEDDWVKLSLSIPFTDAPGTKFVYNNVGPYLAGVLVQRRSGCDLVNYLMPRFFAHLGIKRPTWECDPLGYTFGAGGLFLTLSELHLLGEFCLDEGRWNGKQLLKPEWIRECAKQPGDDNYGYLFWRGKYGSYRADGKYSQISMILPDKEAVITIVSESRNAALMLDLIYEEICPKL